MTIVEMLGQSGVLTLLGMGIVFGFLAILIVAVTWTGKIIHALSADKSDQGSAVQQPPTPTTSSGASTAAKTAAVTAAITAAVNEYRKDN
jgi:oxaloacetate decarboxylase gamma subunit